MVDDRSFVRRLAVSQVHLNEPSPVECRDVEVYFLVIP